MSTRSATTVKDKDGNVLIRMYRQSDGYQEGHGEELKEFLKDMCLINGVSIYQPNLANGMGCLAAQIVAHFKTEVGQFYLEPANSLNIEKEQFEYTVYPTTLSDNSPINIRVENSHKVLFEGLITDYLAKDEHGE